MAFFSPKIGIDLGSNFVLCYVPGRGVVLREPSLVVVRGGQKREAVAVGQDAQAMLGRLPAGHAAVSPVRDGVVADFEMTVVMLVAFLRRALSAGRLGRPRAVVAVPSEITETERRAVQEALWKAGCVPAHITDIATAAAFGCGLPVAQPQGSMVVDIGGGTTEVAVLSMGFPVVSQSLRIGGNAMDEAIIAFAKKNSNLLIGSRMAEDIKMDLGGAQARTEAQAAFVRGRDLITGLPQVLEMDSDQVYEALKAPLDKILAAVKWVLERTPPELGADVMRTGIHLTGGVAQLPELDQYIAAGTGIQATVARNPMECVALGLGYIAENLELLDRAGQTRPPVGG